ncbi:SDR family oxidoreductase [Nonomuraea composti]|uniref:SDR family oxidoreductase n=1 Tax=Nonomuraea composti TaxID=2720023 RepID=UPI00198179EB|nr:NAD(P)H-binding protein [Nonomuraea sp. FMUSA5-5]
MTILVTGATGTVGRHVVRHLLDHRQPVRALTRHPACAALPAGVEVAEGDLTSAAGLEAAFDGGGRARWSPRSGRAAWSGRSCSRCSSWPTP